MTSHTGTSDHTAIPAVIIGTSAWLIALVAVSVTSGVSAPLDGVWWWAVCLVGSVSGLIGLVFLRWRRTRLLRSGRMG